MLNQVERRASWREGFLFFIMRAALSVFSRTNKDQTNTFEPVDTLSDHVVQSLAAIGECLLLLHRDSQLRQNYTNDRRWSFVIHVVYIMRCLCYSVG